MTKHDQAVDYFICKHGLLQTKGRTNKYSLLVGNLLGKPAYVFVGKLGAIHLNRNNSHISSAISVTHLYEKEIEKWITQKSLT